MIEWTPDLSTGVPLLDEHHKTIFKWLAELENAATEDRTLFGVYALTRLNRYMREHFAAEESLMKAAGYPALAEHMAEHAYFREKIGELHVKSIANDISMETVDFLKNWLTNHIAKTDMAYVPYLGKSDRA
jgi:hemerythrin